MRQRGVTEEGWRTGKGGEKRRKKKEGEGKDKKEGEEVQDEEEKKYGEKEISRREGSVYSCVHVCLCVYECIRSDSTLLSSAISSKHILRLSLDEPQVL